MFTKYFCVVTLPNKVSNTNRWRAGQESRFSPLNPLQLQGQTEVAVLAGLSQAVTQKQVRFQRSGAAPVAASGETNLVTQ